MKRDFEIVIRPDKRLKQLQLLVAEWSERTEHLLKMIPYLAADHVRKDMMDRIPKGEDWAAYRSSLGVAQVTGAPVGLAAYVLRSDLKDRRVKQLDAPKTLLYVKPLKRMGRVKPEILILEKYSPWTVQLLPFMPKRGEASVISRRVHPREIARVEKDRTRDRPQWRRALDRAGHREVKKDKRLKIPKKMHTIPDVAFEALRLEFGLGGVKGVPHWRPALHRLISTGLRSMFRRDPHLVHVLTRRSFRGWKTWPPRTRHKVRMGDMRNYLPFQRKLGIHV